MIALEILIAFGIALAYAMLIIPVLGAGWAGANEFIFSFVLLFLVMWDGAVWFRPLGPTVDGIPWLLMLAFGGVTALLLAILIQPWPNRPRRVSGSGGSTVAETTFVSFGLTFWLAVVILLGMIVGSYALLGR